MKTLSSWQVVRCFVSRRMNNLCFAYGERGWLSKVLSSRCRGLNLVFTLCWSAGFRFIFIQPLGRNKTLNKTRSIKLKKKGAG